MVPRRGTKGPGTGTAGDVGTGTEGQTGAQRVPVPVPGTGETAAGITGLFGVVLRTWMLRRHQEAFATRALGLLGPLRGEITEGGGGRCGNPRRTEVRIPFVSPDRSRPEVFR
jgi:hypothetical protein